MILITLTASPMLTMPSPLASPLIMMGVGDGVGDGDGLGDGVGDGDGPDTAINGIVNLDIGQWDIAGVANNI